MKRFVYILLIFFLLAAALPAGTDTVRPAETREYQIKAAFIYNFIIFAEWQEHAEKNAKDRPQSENKSCESPPKPEKDKENKELLIGIVGDDPFGDSFKPIERKGIDDRKVRIVRFKSCKKLTDDKKKQLAACRVLFISKSEHRHLEQILKILQKSRTMTIGEDSDFLEKGGMIRFAVKDKKIRFEINLAAAERAAIKFRSKLIRLAARVIKKDIYSKVEKTGDNNED